MRAGPGVIARAIGWSASPGSSSPTASRRSAGNAVLMALLAGALGWPPIPANVVAVALMSLVNFVTADRWVFPGPGGRRLAAAMLGVAWLCVPSIAAAQSAETIAAWQRYVEATEARLERSRTLPRAATIEAIAADGESIRVPSGTISDWRGSVFIRGITLDRLLQRLQHPGTPPPQDDVVSSRVLVAYGRFAARLHPSGPPRHRHRDLRHRARDALSPLDAAAGDRAQRRDADRRGRRQRPWVPVAPALVLALRRDRRRRAGGSGVADPQPRRAVDRPPDRRAADHADRAGVHGPDPRRAPRFFSREGRCWPQTR